MIECYLVGPLDGWRYEVAYWLLVAFIANMAVLPLWLCVIDRRARNAR